MDRFTTLWPFNSMGQKHTKRTDNLVVTFHCASDKLPVSMQACDHFPGTEQYRVQCCKALLWGWGMGPHLAGSSKIWSFESQSMARDIKKNCNVSPADIIKGRHLRKAWDAEGKIVHFSMRGSCIVVTMTSPPQGREGRVLPSSTPPPTSPYWLTSTDFREKKTASSGGWVTYNNPLPSVSSRGIFFTRATLTANQSSGSFP